MQNSIRKCKEHPIYSFKMSFNIYNKQDYTGKMVTNTVTTDCFISI